MQRKDFFLGGISGGIFRIVFIAVIFIIFQFQFRVILKADPAVEGNVKLTWTAPGDDNANGRAVQYDIRYSLDPLTEATWSSAIKIPNQPTPDPAGTTESVIISGLIRNQVYYFGIKTQDESGNWSALSNIVRVAANLTYDCGDVNDDGMINISDAIAIINYVFFGGQFNAPATTADVNCDGAINISDAIYLINYAFVLGASPCDQNDDGVPDC